MALRASFLAVACSHVSCVCPATLAASLVTRLRPCAVCPVHPQGVPSEPHKNRGNMRRCRATPWCPVNILQRNRIRKICLHPPLLRTDKKKPYYEINSVIFNTHAGLTGGWGGIERSPTGPANPEFQPTRNSLGTSLGTITKTLFFTIFGFEPLTKPYLGQFYHSPAGDKKT